MAKTEPSDSEPDPSLTPWRVKYVSDVIDVAAAIIWRVRWIFRPVYLATRRIPWPLRLVGWFAAYWFLIRALTGAYGDDWLQRLWWGIADFAAAAPGRIDAALTAAPGAAWDALTWAPSHLAEILAVLALIAILLAAAVILRDLRQDKIIVEPFSVPEDLARQGYDSVAFTRRLMAAVEAEAADIPEDWGALGSGLAGEAPDLELPGGRLSLARLTEVLRHVLLAAPRLRAMLGVKPERVIVGSVVRAKQDDGADMFELHASVRGWPGTDVSASGAGAEPLVEAAAPQLVGVVDPERRVAALASDQPADAERLIRDAKRRLSACPWSPSWAERRQIDRLSLLSAFYGPTGAANREARLKAFVRMPRWPRSRFRSWYDQGFALDQLGERRPALTALRRALAIKPYSASALCNRGNAFFRLHCFDAALEAYDHALVVKHDYATAHYNRGNTLRALERFDEALKAYDRTIAVKTGYARARFNAVLTIRKLDDPADGIDARLARARRAVEHAEAYVALAPEADNHWILDGAKRLLAEVEKEAAEAEGEA